jgi:hypothetical protein
MPYLEVTSSKRADLPDPFPDVHLISGIIEKRTGL